MTSHSALAIDPAGPSDVDTAFSHPAFDAGKRDNAPCLILAASPVRVLWANAAAGSFFGAASADDLARLLERQGGDVARRVSDMLARSAATSPRLERARVVRHRRVETVTLLCARVDLDGRPALALTVPGRRVEAPTGSWREPASASIAAEPGPGQGRPVTEERLRFLWKTDALGQVTHIERGAFETAEAPVIPVPGRRLADAVRAFDPGGADRLGAILALGRGAVAIEIAWPVSSGRAIAPVVLKGTPWFDPGRNFAGHKGFGIIDLGRLTSGPTAVPAAPGPGLPSSAEEEAVPAEAPTAPPANVVQLRPLNAVRVPVDAPDQPNSASEPPGHDAAEAIAAPEAAGAPQLDAGLSGPEAAEAVAAEPAHLSSSEQEAFQEIGRTLQSGGLEHQDASGRADASGDADVQNNAAAIVDATEVGLLVLRGPKLLFANQAVLDMLRYATQADAEIGLGAALAQSAARIAGGDEHAVVLPGQDGEPVRLDVSAGPLAWDGSPARLWTLRRAAIPAPLPPQPTASGETAPRAATLDEQALLDVVEEAAALLDGSGRVVVANRALDRLLGRRGGAGEPVSLLLASQSRQQAEAALSRAQDGVGQTLGVAALSSDGVPLELDMRLCKIGPDRMVATWRDKGVTRPTAAATDGRQPELLATLSHQIRTPLNAIIGFAEVMMDERFGPLGNPRYKDYLKDVHASGAQVMSLVNDLLDLSRIESGRHDLDLGAVDVNRIILDSVAHVQTDAHRARVIVRTSLSPRQPMVMADDGAARQIVANLLSNAIKFNEPGGQVIVSTATNETGAVLVRIRDTGIGMSDPDIEAALEPFRRLEPARQTDGTGLGLPLTKALVGANGASLSIRSRRGEGTLVEVTFQPAAAPTRVPA